MNGLKKSITKKLKTIEIQYFITKNLYIILQKTDLLNY